MDILETIAEQKRVEVASLPTWGAVTGEPRRGFLAALQRPRRGSIALIAEVKKASPSAGVICPDFDPTGIARQYEEAGATCLSVLTDVKFFQGALEYLQAIRSAVQLPLLRKDFIIDERQIAESFEWGADAILLIVAILTDVQLSRYLDLARQAQLDALVEVHDEAELERALQAGAQLIGVNNRNLRTFQVDLATTERLAARLHQRQQAGVLLVAESGIHRPEDVTRLQACGAQAILVGESLMREGNIRAQVEKLIP